MKKVLLKINNKLLSIYIIIAFFVLWEVAPKVGWANPHFVPPFSVIIAEAQKLTFVQLFVEASVSLKRIFIGFAIASLLALPVGFILGGAFPRLENFLKSLLKFLSQIPPFILFPVFVVVFGIGEKGIYTVILWAAFWPIMFTTITGVQSVEPILIKSARSMGANNFTIFLKIILPGALSSILTGMKTGMTMSFMMLIGAETLGADSGLGWLIHNAQSMGFIPRIYLAAILIAVLGLGVNYIFQWLEENIIVWKEASHDKAI
jgi:NitT/TauT family transport system permease protein